MIVVGRDCVQLRPHHHCDSEEEDDANDPPFLRSKPTNAIFEQELFYPSGSSLRECRTGRNRSERLGYYIGQTCAVGSANKKASYQVRDQSGHQRETTHPEQKYKKSRGDRKSTRLNSQSLRHLVCRLLLEKKKK